MEENSAEFLNRLGMDGQLWAQEFLKMWGDKFEEVDEGLMIAWFANSIMSGWDNKSWSLPKRDEILGLCAQGYCTPRNGKKIMDADLMTDIADIIAKRLGVQ